METVEREKVYVEQKHKEYASKGVAGTALGLGIAGTALWLLGNNGRGLFGGCGHNSGDGVATPTAYQVERKECDDVVALTNAFWQARVTQMNERFADRQVINSEMFGLYKSQIDADFLLYKGNRDSYDSLKSQIDELRTQVAVGAAVRPYQDKLIQCEIDRAFTAGINYTDRKTCRMISGEVVLPNTPTVTGYQSYNPCHCNVVTSAPAA
jgi:hypothetical protein